RPGARAGGVYRGARRAQEARVGPKTGGRGGPPPRAWPRLSPAGAAPGSIIAAIIATHTAMKDANEPRLVATPMSIPCICQTATTQDAAASTSVAASAAASAGVLGAAKVGMTPWSVMMS